MAKIDSKFTLGPCSIEMHAGQTSGDGGTNASGPADAPNVHPKIATTSTVINKTVGSTHIVSPA